MKEGKGMKQSDFDQAYRNFRRPEFPEDVKRIQEVVKTELGIQITPEQAYDVWHDHSGDYAAEWLSIQDDDIVRAFVGFVQCFLTNWRGEISMSELVERASIEAGSRP